MTDLTQTAVSTVEVAEATPTTPDQPKPQSIYDLYKTEAEQEKKGFFYKLSPTIGILMARAGGANSNFTKFIDVETRPIRKQIKGDRTSRDVLDMLQDIMKQAFAATVILDWQGITHPTTGEILPYNQENALMLMRELPDLFADLQEQAMELANFQSEALDDDAKN